MVPICCVRSSFLCGWFGLVLVFWGFSFGWYSAAKASTCSSLRSLWVLVLGSRRFSSFHLQFFSCEEVASLLSVDG